MYSNDDTPDERVAHEVDVEVGRGRFHIRGPGWVVVALVAAAVVVMFGLTQWATPAELSSIIQHLRG